LLVISGLIGVWGSNRCHQGQRAVIQAGVTRLAFFLPCGLAVINNKQGTVAGPGRYRAALRPRALGQRARSVARVCGRVSSSSPRGFETGHRALLVRYACTRRPGGASASVSRGRARPAPVTDVARATTSPHTIDDVYATPAAEPCSTVGEGAPSLSRHRSPPPRGRRTPAAGADLKRGAHKRGARARARAPRRVAGALEPTVGKATVGRGPGASTQDLERCSARLPEHRRARPLHCQRFSLCSPSATSCSGRGYIPHRRSPGAGPALARFGGMGARWC
jgi:hypothetical protein